MPLSYLLLQRSKKSGQQPLNTTCNPMGQAAAFHSVQVKVTKSLRSIYETWFIGMNVSMNVATIPGLLIRHSSIVGALSSPIMVCGQKGKLGYVTNIHTITLKGSMFLFPVLGNQCVQPKPNCIQG